MNQVRELVTVKVEVFASRQERERRERAQVVQPITEDNALDWRSYGRRAVPNRWRVR